MDTTTFRQLVLAFLGTKSIPAILDTATFRRLVLQSLAAFTSDPSVNSITASSFVQIGPKARILATATGCDIQTLVNGQWVTQAQF